ncbi:Solute carrier organic anion transporter family member 3A1 [Folsomia candida]|uniref:Solute carrier organic anion transporter family member 3A1 n=1 Tax=Folsomia candida TaxID=158441 RepID=A0A226EKC9_FOLCA|nr:Solute carrier organic anion transporter family member 3A1 [Folsomia candida]
METTTDLLPSQPAHPRVTIATSTVKKEKIIPTYYGFEKFHPQFLQCFANRRAFLIVFCITCVLQGTFHTYFVAVITTLEKLFNIPSRTIGTLMMASEVGQVRCAARSSSRTTRAKGTVRAGWVSALRSSPLRRYSALHPIFYYLRKILQSLQCQEEGMRLSSFAQPCKMKPVTAFPWRLILMKRNTIFLGSFLPVCYRLGSEILRFLRSGFLIWMITLLIEIRRCIFVSCHGYSRIFLLPWK